MRLADRTSLKLIPSPPSLSNFTYTDSKHELHLQKSISTSTTTTSSATRGISMVGPFSPSSSTSSSSSASSQQRYQHDGNKYNNSNNGTQMVGGTGPGDLGRGTNLGQIIHPRALKPPAARARIVEVPSRYVPGQQEQRQQDHRYMQQARNDVVRIGSAKTTPKTTTSDWPGLVSASRASPTTPHALQRDIYENQEQELQHKNDELQLHLQQQQQQHSLVSPDPHPQQPNMTGTPSRSLRYSSFAAANRNSPFEDIAKYHYQLWCEALAVGKPLVRFRPIVDQKELKKRRKNKQQEAIAARKAPSKKLQQQLLHESQQQFANNMTGPSSSSLRPESFPSPSSKTSPRSIKYELVMIGYEKEGSLASISNLLSQRGFNVLRAKVITLPYNSMIDVFQLEDHSNYLTEAFATSEEEDQQNSNDQHWSDPSHCPVIKDPSIIMKLYDDLYGLIDSTRARQNPLSSVTTLPEATNTTATTRSGAGPINIYGDDVDADDDMFPDSPMPLGRFVICDGFSFSPAAGGDNLNNKDINMPSSPSPSSMLLIKNGNLTKSFSNLALLQSSQEAKVEEIRVKRENDIEFVLKGDYLTFYDFDYSTGQFSSPQTNFFTVSSDKKYIQWGEDPYNLANSSPISQFVGLSIGYKSELFRDQYAPLQKLEHLNMAAGPFQRPLEYLSFTLRHKVNPKMDLNFAAPSLDLLYTWVLGLQALCDFRYGLVEFIASDHLFFITAKLKLREIAAEKHVTVRTLLIDAIISAANNQKRIMTDASVTMSSGEFAYEGTNPGATVVNITGSGTIVGTVRAGTGTNSAQLQVGTDIEKKLECLARKKKLLEEQLQQAKVEIRRLNLQLKDSQDQVDKLTDKLRVEQASLETDFKEITLLEAIGGGTYSQLWRAKWRGTIVACKVMKGHEELDNFLAEVNVLSKLRHPNITLFMTASVQVPKLCIVMEYCRGGNLFTALRKSMWRRLGYLDFIHFARGVAKGLAYMHSLGLIHRDIKTQNLLLDSPLESGRPNIKIADFGLSRKNEATSRSGEGIMTSETGTYRWMAPEVIKHEPYNEKIDVYSFGIILWEFYTCEIPFADMTPIQAAFSVADKERRPIPVTDYGKANVIPPAWNKLVQQCWHANPRYRPRFAEIIDLLNDMERRNPDEISPLWKKWDEVTNTKP